MMTNIFVKYSILTVELGIKKEYKRMVFIVVLVEDQKIKSEKIKSIFIGGENVIFCNTSRKVEN